MADEKIVRLRVPPAGSADPSGVLQSSYGSSGGSGGGGSMDDILKRLHTVEVTVSDVRAQISGITATVPHLATKSDVSTAVHSITTKIIGWMFALLTVYSGIMVAIKFLF